jgi:hypothetical protein
LLDQEQRIVPPEQARVELSISDTTVAQLDADLTAAANYSFALGREIPIRATLFRLSAHDHALLLLLHHSAADGWSVAPLLADLQIAYAARRRNEAPVFPPLAIQYADYTLWQRQVASDMDRHIAYWTDKLAGLPAELALPTDRPRPAKPTYSGGVTVLAAPSPKLLDCARQHGATPFMLLEAVLAVLLSKLGAGDDIPLGAPIAGRTEVALDPLIGFFVNTLVLRTDVSGNPRFTEILQRARATCLEAYEHQDAPFERLVELLDPPRAFGRQPLFQTMLVLQNNRQAQLALPDLDTEPLELRVNHTKFDLTFIFTETEDGLAGQLEYSEDLFDRSSV